MNEIEHAHSLEKFNHNHFENYLTLKQVEKCFFRFMTSAPNGSLPCKRNVENFLSEIVLMILQGEVLSSETALVGLNHLRKVLHIIRQRHDRF